MGKEPLEQFEEEWTAWLDRPTALSPKMAAQRVAGRLKEPPRPSWRSWWFLRRRPVTALVALLVFFGFSLLLLRNESRQPPQTAAANLTMPAPSGNVLVIKLDSETSLYLTLATALDSAEGESDSGDLL